MIKMINKHTIFALVAMTALAALAQPSYAHKSHADNHCSEDGYGHRQMMGHQMGFNNYGPGSYGPGMPPWGHHGPRMSDGRYEGRYDSLLAGLDLTSEQRKAIHKIYKDSRSKMRRLHDDLSDKRHELYELLDEAYDAKAVRKLADSMAALMADRIVMRSEMQAKINAVLTPEQREQADDFHGGGWWY